MTSTTSVYPIRGHAHRRPAPYVLSVLFAGAPLMVEREPDNAYDPNALKVMLDWSEHPGIHKSLEELWGESNENTVEVFGDNSLPDEDYPFHLSYVGKEFAAVLSPKMDALGVTTLAARLSFTPEGKLGVEIEDPEGEEEDECTDAEVDPGDFSEGVDPDVEPDDEIPY